MLVEALIGMGMLALVSASLLTVSRVWIPSVEAAQVRSDAVELARIHSELEVLAREPSMNVREGYGRHDLRSFAEVWELRATESGRCGEAGALSLGGSLVTVQARAADGPPLVQLRATRLEPVRVRTTGREVATDTHTIRVEGSVAPGTLVAVESRIDQAAGGPGLLAIDDSGCLSLAGLLPGNYVLRPVMGEAAPRLVDAAQRVDADVHLDFSVMHGRSSRSWVLSEGAVLGVESDALGAREADLVSPAGLRWMVRGDDARTLTALGAARPLHPGTVAVVVSACENPEAFGSTGSVDLAPGETRVLRVPLAVVTLAGLSGRADDAISAVRTVGCADGTGARPSVRWEGGLNDGMRVALPHGEWAFSVETLGGTALTYTILVRAGEPNASASFP
jgi:hypothetical protein